MSIRFYISVLLIAACLLCCCSRNNQAERVCHEQDRDNVILVSDQLFSIDSLLPDMHSATGLSFFGDTLIFKDTQSADFVFTAFDANTDHFLGRFGKFGNGPGEVANVGSIFYDNLSKKFYADHGNRGKMVSFYLPVALCDSTIDATDEFSVGNKVGDNIMMEMVYANDSTVYCNLFVPDKTGGPNSMTTHIARFNPKTQSTDIIDSIPPGEKVRSGMAVSFKHGRIVCADKKQDKIRVFNLDGKLLHYIYGPEYEEETSRRRSYFGSIAWCGDKVAALFTGIESSEDNDKIIIMDKDGNYIATLKFDFTVYSIAYHERTGRLYLSTYGEPQFGCIELDKVLNSNIH